VVLDDAQAEVEAAWQVNGDHSEVLTQAEDAAIIRQALALLSPAERAALVMWEMEGRSTEEIAAELGIKESAVRHTVSRARTSLRRVLSELVIDEERGLTALDMLSTTYKKAAELAAKSSKVALSLLLVVTAFLGFNSMTGREGALPTAITQDSTGVTAEAGSTESTEAASPAPSISMPAKKSSTMVSGLYIKSAKATWPGLDSEGIPTGFTVTGENGPAGDIRVNRNVPVATEEGTILATQAITSGGGPNVAFDQIVTVDGNGTKYEVEYISLGIKGVWAVAEARATSVDFERMSNGQYLMTVTISLVSTPTSELSIAVGNRGYDIVGAPKTITTRLLLNASKTQILAQAILIPDSGTKAKG
jgi:DNA-binding CsgD family transcriptional regulator